MEYSEARGGPNHPTRKSQQECGLLGNPSVWCAYAQDITVGSVQQIDGWRGTGIGGPAATVRTVVVARDPLRRSRRQRSISTIEHLQADPLHGPGRFASSLPPPASRQTRLLTWPYPYVSEVAVHEPEDSTVFWVARKLMTLFAAPDNASELPPMGRSR